MSKLELFIFLQNLDDKSGGFKKPESIKKRYPEIYEGIEKTIFPEHFTFVQKLWHYLQDDFTIHRCKCGKEVKFIDFKRGYRTYCSRDCECVVEHNKSTLKKAQEVSRRPESRQKAVNTIIERNGGVFWIEEDIQRLRDTYKTNREQMVKKIKNTIEQNLKNSKEIYKKSIKGVSSRIEMEFYSYLIRLFGEKNIDPQHLDKNKYPFACDFYIKPIDVYVELNGMWTHGGHPFNPKNPDDIEKLEMWRSKDNKFYNNAIYTWTDLDARKRKTATKNRLNYIEIFSNDIEGCIKEFNDYFHEMVFKYCMVAPFPGTSKWRYDHPIWNCYVGKYHSPIYAWNDPYFMKEAVDNWFYMHQKDSKVERAYIKELMTCKIENNLIRKSSQRFLELILNRLTIAKIAPKVTAISDKTVKKIIDESGVDISNGVYVPMAGFGGIPSGVKLWSKEHSKNVECECYDINPLFCEWYGWSERDMLKQKVKTDKVVICCPPFGKDYEHWNGTPKKMSNIDFKNWYRLIKEYIDAPEYIIIGPEIGKKNEKTGLFAKSTGVMLWNDEMVKKL